MKNFTFDLSLISKYRSALMGIATIGILMCHANAYGVSLPFHLDSVFGLGQGGVMIFFFVSGVGLYFSSRKIEYSVSGVLSWYKKRFIRLFVPYLIIYGTALFVELSENPVFPIGEYLFRLSTLSYWTDQTGAWFVAVLVPLYLLTPLWNKLQDNNIISTVLTVLAFAAMSFIPSPFKSAFSQAAFFFVGFWMSRYIMEGIELSFKTLAYCIAFFAVLLCGYYIFDIGNLLMIIVIPFVFFFCWILDMIRLRWLNKLLEFFGSISLESYLLNVTLIVWIDHFNLLPGVLYSYRYMFIVVTGILLATIINRITKPLISLACSQR